ncbi:MAG: Ig-like domain-containing protein, partial [Clostridia bacterium]
KSVTIEPGQTVQLELHARMSDGSDRDVTELAMWSSSKPTYAIIDATGKLTAKKAGKTSIVAKYGGKTVTISVTVKK